MGVAFEVTVLEITILSVYSLVSLMALGLCCVIGVLSLNSVTER
jgi:hypothetical protein